MNPRVTLLYLHVTKSGYPEAAPPEYYVPFSQRWIDTYKAFDPGIEHKVRIVSCGAPPTPDVEGMYQGIQCDWDMYPGAGSDLGACQSVMQNIDTEIVVCMSTPVYFWRSGWLAKIVGAFDFFGDGLYGPMASYHHFPHIRTSCWAVNPKTFMRYPHLIDTREKCCWAEHADHEGEEPWQISKWYEFKCMPVLMVTWDQVLAKSEWRKPDNIFRRGDQSNCLVWDQHVDVYRCAHYHERLELASMSDGLAT